MNCDEAVERFSEALDGALGEGERAELEGHLAGCAACRSRRDGMAEVRGLLRSLEDPESGDVRAAAVARGVRAAANPAVSRRRLGAVILTAAAGLGVLALLLHGKIFPPAVPAGVHSDAPAKPVHFRQSHYKVRATGRDVLEEMKALFKDCPGRAVVSEIRQDGQEYAIEIEVTGEPSAAFDAKVDAFQARHSRQIVGWESRSSTR